MYLPIGFFNGLKLRNHIYTQKEVLDKEGTK